MTLGKTLTVVGGVLVLVPPLSLLHPWGNVRATSQPNRRILAGANVPPEVREVLETKCIDCHTEATHWPVYSRIAPSSWLVEHDVFEARNHLNLSRWEEYSRESQNDLLTKNGSEARSGEMPVRHYLVLHPKTRLSTQEQQLLYDWARVERKRVRNEAAQQEP
ncbi:MAG: heme-binding domain-containing protein [Alloacidobacterium sp.]